MSRTGTLYHERRCPSQDEATPRDRDEVEYSDRPDAVQARYREEVLAELDKVIPKLPVS